MECWVAFQNLRTLTWRVMSRSISLALLLRRQDNSVSAQIHQNQMNRFPQSASFAMNKFLFQTANRQSYHIKTNKLSHWRPDTAEALGYEASAFVGQVWRLARRGRRHGTSASRRTSQRASRYEWLFAKPPQLISLKSPHNCVDIGTDKQTHTATNKLRH